MSDAVIVALIAGSIALVGSVPAYMVALAALKNAKLTKKEISEIHFLINGRLDELLLATKAISHAKGMADEKEMHNKETKP